MHDSFSGLVRLRNSAKQIACQATSEPCHQIGKPAASDFSQRPAPSSHVYFPHIFVCPRNGKNFRRKKVRTEELLTVLMNKAKPAALQCSNSNTTSFRCHGPQKVYPFKIPIRHLAFPCFSMLFQTAVAVPWQAKIETYSTEFASPDNVTVQETLQVGLQVDLVDRLLFAGHSALLWSLNPWFWEVQCGAFQKMRA